MSLGLRIPCLFIIGWCSLGWVETRHTFLSDVVCDQVPEEALFPEGADKHHVITAPYILLDGISLTPVTCVLTFCPFTLRICWVYGCTLTYTASLYNSLDLQNTFFHCLLQVSA